MPIPVSDDEMQLDLVVIAFIERGFDQHFSPRRELYRVTNQVDQDLANARSISNDMTRYCWPNVQCELEAFLVGSHGHGLHCLFDAVVQVKADGIQRRFSGFDL